MEYYAKIMPEFHNNSKIQPGCLPAFLQSASLSRIDAVNSYGYPLMKTAENPAGKSPHPSPSCLSANFPIQLDCVFVGAVQLFKLKLL
jgi:hypothetical protein